MKTQPATAATYVQRINLAIMRAVAAKGLSFAYPTQTLHVASLPEKKG